jgi:hydroxymethylpyrimidine pyrophosphatase-like HAD family hydrolase
VAAARQGAVYLDLDGTLLGPGGNLFRGLDGEFCDAAMRALELLTSLAIPYVFVSGRSAARVAEAARMLGADGALAEIGALDAGYRTRPGQTVHEAIAETGIPAELLEREPDLEEHPVSALGRQGSHVLRGKVRTEAFEWTIERSNGELRLADNGRIGPGEVNVYHLLPTTSSKSLSVQKDVARRGILASACLSVGDSREDMEIGRVVGTTALVANGAVAEPELAELASFVTEASHGAGVREAIERWLEADR